MPRGIGGEFAWYCPTFDDSPNDVSGNALHGTYQGAMGTVANVSNGGQRAYRFDGINDYIKILASNLFGLMSDFTVAAWVLPSGITQYSCVVTNKQTVWNATNGWSFQHHQANGVNGHFDWIGAGGSYHRNSPLQFTAGVWKHLAITGTRGVTQTTVTKYVNGAAIGSGLVNNVTLSQAGNEIWIGRTISLYTHSDQDDIRLFNRVLTNGQLVKLASRRFYQPYLPKSQSSAVIGTGLI